MMGGPGSGKSFVRERAFGQLPVVDCDKVKEHHPDYDPRNPSELHEWSRAECVREFFARLGAGESFVYDGTGTNVDKMVDWMLRAQSAGFRVELVFVKAPLNVALARNADRERVVPEEVVREKHALIETAFRIVREYADTVTEVENG